MNDSISVALITGAARGIGRAIALELARPGLTMYLNDVALGEEAARTQKDVEAKGAQARLIEFNVADFSQVQARPRGDRQGERPPGPAGEQRRHHPGQPHLAHERGRMGRGPDREPQGRL